MYNPDSYLEAGAELEIWGSRVKTPIQELNERILGLVLGVLLVF